MSEGSPGNSLLERWLAGDARAANEVVDAHFDALFRFFHAKLPAEAADLTQRVFLCAFEGRSRGSLPRNLRAYLFGIARHLLLDHLRASHRGRWQGASSSSLFDWRGSPSSLLAADEERKQVRLALERLPVDMQILLELYYWEDMRMVEVAEVLEIPEGTVKSRLHRARQRLAELLASPARGAAPPERGRASPTPRS